MLKSFLDQEKKNTVDDRPLQYADAKDTSAFKGDTSRMDTTIQDTTGKRSRSASRSPAPYKSNDYMFMS